MNTQLFFDELSLERTLARMSPRHRLVFAIACVERLMPTAPPSGGGPPGVADARMIVYRLAREFQGGSVAPRDLPGLEATCMSALSDTRPGGGAANEVVEAVLVAVRHCVRCRQTGSPVDAIAAARCIYEEVAAFAARQLGADSALGDKDPRVAAHALVQAELARQRRDLAELARELDVTLATTAARLWHLARRARASMFDPSAASAVVAAEDTEFVMERRTLVPQTGTGPAVIVRRRPAVTSDHSAPTSDPALARGARTPLTVVRDEPPTHAPSKEVNAETDDTGPSPPTPPKSEPAPLESGPAMIAAKIPHRSQPKKLSPTAFIQSCSASLTTAEVLALAKKEGIRIYRADVESVRKTAQQRGIRLGERGAPRRTKAPNVAKPVKRSREALFVLAHPGLSVMALLGRARRERLAISEDYIFKVRDAERRGVPIRPGRPPRARPDPRPVIVPKPRDSEPDTALEDRPTQRVLRADHEPFADGTDAVLSASTHERMLLAAVAELGLSRAFAILEKEREKARDLLPPLERQQFG